MEILLAIMTLVIIVMVFRVFLMVMPSRDTHRRQRIQAEARQAEWEMDQMTRTTLGQMLDEARRHRPQ